MDPAVQMMCSLTPTGLVRSAASLRFANKEKEVVPCLKYSEHVRPGAGSVTTGLASSGTKGAAGAGDMAQI